MKTRVCKVIVVLLFALLTFACQRKAKSTPTVPDGLRPSPTPTVGEDQRPSPTPTVQDGLRPSPTPTVRDGLRPSPTTTPTPALPSGTEGFPWWSDSVFYEIFVRSFYDSNGDGIGDFQGIIQKLDYLNDGNPSTTTDLGITGIWLMPINPSPSYHGYDVTAYYAVNSQYGTMDDFEQLIAEAHQRGIRVIMDLVLNHTSSAHPWFQASKDPASPYRDWYIWSATDPGYLGPWGEKVWHQWPGVSGYYYAVFWDQMPDLNYSNPGVTTQMEDVARYWLQDVGVDGFRLDAAMYLVEEGKVQANTKSTHAWWKDFHSLVKGWSPQGMIIGEVWQSNTVAAEYINADELDMTFNFDLAQNIITALNNQVAGPVEFGLDKGLRLAPQWKYGTFLTNHDQARAMSQLFGSVDKAKVAATILLTLPGTPFIYYGEEIGMTGNKPDERIRTPMQWSSEANAGFSSASPWEALNDDYASVNVSLEASDPTSLLTYYRALVNLRNQHAALRVGGYLAVDCDQSGLLTFLRLSQDEVVLVVVNLGKQPVKGYNLSITSSPLSGDYSAVPLFVGSLPGDTSFLAPGVDAQGGFAQYSPVSEIPAYGAIILVFR